MGIQILNSQDMPAKPLHTFVYGPIGTGKTTFASTFPNPVFLSAGNEGGDTTLRFCAPNSIIPISSTADMKEAIGYIKANGKAKHGWRTIVLDSITYYSDLFIQETTQMGTKAMRTQDWGLLDLHLQKWLLPVLMSMPFHVVWIALEEQTKGADGQVVGFEPMLYGKTKAKLPGSCDFMCRSFTRQVRDANSKLVTEYLLRTVPTDGAPARGRFGQAFSDGVLPAHFGAIAQRIGKYIGEEPAKV